MNKKRFQITFGGIFDNLTGETLTTKREVAEVLNNVNDRADRNAELLDIDTVCYYHAVQKILKKYNIDSLEKLDLVLFHQRVW